MSEQTVNSVVNLGIPINPPDGIKNPEVISLYREFIKAENNLLRALEQYVQMTQKSPSEWGTLVPSDTLIRQFAGRYYIKFSETCTFGDFVNIHDVAGIANARKANATSGTVRPARGYCNVLAGVLSGSFGEVILSQGLLTISGLVSGQDIYLSTTAGLATTTPPGGAGQLEQFLGFGVAANLAYIDISGGTYIQH